MASNFKNWNRCIYCGRFISFADFENDNADTEFSATDCMAMSPNEDIEAFHFACKSPTAKAEALARRVEREESYAKYMEELGVVE